jgi:hypothetical protein
LGGFGPLAWSTVCGGLVFIFAFVVIVIILCLSAKNKRSCGHCGKQEFKEEKEDLYPPNRMTDNQTPGAARGAAAAAAEIAPAALPQARTERDSTERADGAAETMRN